MHIKNNDDREAIFRYSVFMTPLKRSPEFDKMRLYSTARKMTGLTIRDLAAAAGVSTNTVNRLENTGQFLKPATLEKIREVLRSRGCDFYFERPDFEWVRPKPPE